MAVKKEAKGTSARVGNVLPKGATPGSTSNTNTRIGNLKKRMKGANGTVGMPK